MYRFKGGSDGAKPHAGLLNVNGILYGTTSGGGGSGCSFAHGCGTVYTISTTGEEKVLYSFRGGSDGEGPIAGLINVNGTLYGSTYRGGGSGCYGGLGCGTVYSISTAGVEKVVHSFTGGSEGAHPIAGLINVNRTLYGTTSQGGDSECGEKGGCGTVYSIPRFGSEKVLHRFGRVPDGQDPRASLIDVNGTLYGTTVIGGSARLASGTVYSISTTGVEKVLHSFDGSDGAFPVAGLIEVNGTLYGTTPSGLHDKGNVYSISTTGVAEVLQRFKGGENGEEPRAGLIIVGDTLYGTTVAGGRSGYGTVFSIPTYGTESVVYSFKGGSDGDDPQAAPIDVNGKLYGTTLIGGNSECVNGGCGTVFALTP
jgi:uncharacterized repeat protein (TIGR03803 family)